MYSNNEPNVSFDQYIPPKPFDMTPRTSHANNVAYLNEEIAKINSIRITLNANEEFTDNSVASNNQLTNKLIERKHVSLDEIKPMKDLL